MVAGPALNRPEWERNQAKPEQALDEVLRSLAEAVIPGQPKLTEEDLVERSGVDPDLAGRLRRAMGLPDVPDAEAAFYEEDLRALLRAKALMDEEGLQPAELLHLTRTLGLAAARMADAVVGFWTDRILGQPPGSAGAKHKWRIDDLEMVVVYLLRRHLLDAITRRLGSSSEDLSAHDLAVGFADLVGFTSLTEQLSDTETAELIERFELLATDIVVGGGGRVVKMIGDEVMFSSDPEQVAEIALSLAEAFDSPGLPSVRVGVAVGRVVWQSGDLYGPVVNLAARATMAARPGTVLVSPGLAELLTGDDRYRVTPIRPHRLKGIGTVQLSVLRRAGRAKR